MKNAPMLEQFNIKHTFMEEEKEMRQEEEEKAE